MQDRNDETSKQIALEKALEALEKANQKRKQFASDYDTLMESFDVGDLSNISGWRTTAVIWKYAPRAGSAFPVTF